jgi:hypothetical protein
MNSASNVVERHDGDTRQKANVQPRQIAVGARQLIELRLLPDPENSESEKAHRVHDESRHERGEPGEQLPLAVHGADLRHANVEHQERHRECEHPVAQSREPLKRAARDAVVDVLKGRLAGAGQFRAVGCN